MGAGSDKGTLVQAARCRGAALFFGNEDIAAPRKPEPVEEGWWSGLRLGWSRPGVEERLDRSE